MGDARIGIRLEVMRANVRPLGPLAILAACAGWERAYGVPALREVLFREWARVEGANPLRAYSYQRVCWERGWLEVGTCCVTAKGWRELGSDGERAA